MSNLLGEPCEDPVSAMKRAMGSIRKNCTLLKRQFYCTLYIDRKTILLQLICYLRICPRYGAKSPTRTSHCFQGHFSARGGREEGLKNALCCSNCPKNLKTCRKQKAGESGCFQNFILTFLSKMAAAPRGRKTQFSHENKATQLPRNRWLCGQSLA